MGKSDEKQIAAKTHLDSERSIEVVEMEVGQLVGMDGNPRKINSKRKNELRKSMEMFGDFGIIVIDENNRIISGHQRTDALLALHGEKHKVLCKRLKGYSEPELRAINIKANTHSGEWDYDKLAAWTADLQIDFALDLPQTDANEREVKGMELIRYEKYDYVMLVCRNEIDYLNLTRKLGIEDKKIVVNKSNGKERKIKCRAIWYDQIKAQIVENKTKDK